MQADRYFLRPKLAPLLCLPLRSKCLLHRLYGPNVYPSSSGRIRIASKTYTFGGENVYVSSVKRMRLGHETYTFCPHRVYVLPSQLPPVPNERPDAPPSVPALYRPLPYCFCRGAEEVCRRKKPTFVVLPRTGSVFHQKCPENGYEPSATYPHTGQGARGRLPA